jgi:Fe-S-cluster-containing hydrogenase component 2
MERQVIVIDQDRCTGCGDCIPNCPEGAIQMIDGKARVVNLSLCDGLGACIGHCPVDAIRIETRDADSYDEVAVLQGILPQGEATLRAHLRHLRDHGQHELLETARAYLEQIGHAVTRDGPAEAEESRHPHAHAGCPGSRASVFAPGGTPPFSAEGGPADGPPDLGRDESSALSHWPVQLHLLSPAAPVFRGRDLLLAADCTAFALGGFHRRLLAGKALAIACPKLDQGQELYAAKIKSLVDDAEVNTITVATMEVPCCGGLLLLAQRAVASARRKVPIKHVTVGIQGEILAERWL